MLAFALVAFLFMVSAWSVRAKRFNNHHFSQLPDDNTPGASYYGEMKFTDSELNRKYWNARGLYAKEQLFDLQEGEEIYSYPYNDENSQDDDYSDDHDVYSNNSSQTELSEDDNVESDLLVWLSDFVTEILFGESYTDGFDENYYYEPKTYLRGYYNSPSSDQTPATGSADTASLLKTVALPDAVVLSPSAGSEVIDTAAKDTAKDTVPSGADSATANTNKFSLENVYEMDDDSGYDGFLDQETEPVEDDTEDDDPNYTYEYYPANYPVDYPVDYHTAETKTDADADVGSTVEDLSSADGSNGYWYYDVAYFVKQWDAWVAARDAQE